MYALTARPAAGAFVDAASFASSESRFSQSSPSLSPALALTAMAASARALSAGPFMRSVAPLFVLREEGARSTRASERGSHAANGRKRREPNQHTCGVDRIAIGRRDGGVP